MSCSFFNNILLGFNLERDQMRTTTRYRGCGHPDVPGAKFCPECGAIMWKEENYPIEDLDYKDFDIKQINTADFEYTNTEGGIAGMILSVDSQTGKIDFPDMSEWAKIEEDLRAVLESHGITPSSAFGLHLARFVSC